jgi:hypothetical protein
MVWLITPYFAAAGKGEFRKFAPTLRGKILGAAGDENLTIEPYALI